MMMIVEAALHVLRDATRKKKRFSARLLDICVAERLGNRALKRHLSTVLKDEIVLDLPNLLCDAGAGIDDSRSTLIRLGEARGKITRLTALPSATVARARRGLCISDQ